MDTICHANKTISNFEETWNNYARTILQYSMSHSFHSKLLKEALIPFLDDELPDNQNAFEIGMHQNVTFEVMLCYSISEDFNDIHSVCVH